jgi:hypothetical protein
MRANENAAASLMAQNLRGSSGFLKSFTAQHDEHFLRRAKRAGILRFEKLAILHYRRGCRPGRPVDWRDVEAMSRGKGSRSSIGITSTRNSHPWPKQKNSPNCWINFKRFARARSPSID